VFKRVFYPSEKRLPQQKRAKTCSRSQNALNNKLVGTLSKTPHPKLTGFTDFLVQAVDSEACQIATFRVANNQLVSVRLKTDVTSNLTEVDLIQAVSGDQFFRPSGFPNKQNSLFDVKQKPRTPPTIPQGWTPASGTPKRSVSIPTCKPAGSSRALTRTELIYVADTYADGLKGKPWDSWVIGTGSCPRIENGVQTTANCAVGVGFFGFDVKGRRWVGNTETGVVLGIFRFYYVKQGWKAQLGVNFYLHEYFKVVGGGLAYLYAPMKGVPTVDAKATIST
jgi:hypothetical protein